MYIIKIFIIFIFLTILFPKIDLEECLIEHIEYQNVYDEDGSYQRIIKEHGFYYCFDSWKDKIIGCNKYNFYCGNTYDKIKHGKWFDYYENGKLMNQKKYEHGEYHGKNYFYSESGYLIKQKTYKDGYLDGMYKSYYSINGQLETEGKFTKMNPDSTWTTYHQNGKLKERSYYKIVKVKNKNYNTYQKTGIWITYDDKGNLVKKEIYEDGKLLETKEY